MKLRVMFVLLLVTAAYAWGCQHKRSGDVTTKVTVNDDSSRSSGDGRTETRRTFELSPGAEVEVRGINGSVEIETAEGPTAEVYIVSTGHNKEAIERRQIIIEQTPTSLTIYGEQGRSFWSKIFGTGEVKHQVSLKLPRRVELTATGINGPLTIGEIEGSLHTSGINGHVELVQSASATEVSGINGGVTVNVARLGEEGLEVNGINGGVELRMAGGIGADLSVRGLNGSITLDVPDVIEQQREGRSNLDARIGKGGAPINVNGVNGSLRLSPLATASVH